MKDMTDVQTTYEKLKEIADNDPLTFREEWNKGLGYGALLSIKKMEEIDSYFVFDGCRMVSADKISDLLDWLIYNYDRAVYRWVYNVAFPEFSVTNDEKSFYNQLDVKGE